VQLKGPIVLHHVAAVVLLRAAAAVRVAVLEGGLPAWRAAQLPLETAPVSQQQLTAATAAAQSKQTTSTYKYQAALKHEKVTRL
jgi:3-mercaptopyruvate sulfurtransferase SseA